MVLLFDESSYGNPGPGGAGAVIAHVARADTNPAILWSSAVHILDPSTTTHQAAYRGLLDGLRAAHANGWRDLTVIRSSGLILRQLREYRAPRNERLRPLYNQARYRDLSLAPPGEGPQRHGQVAGDPCDGHSPIQPRPSPLRQDLPRRPASARRLQLTALARQPG